MIETPHEESHFTASEIVRDVVIGMSDGLTVPFALAAGLSGALDDSRIIVTAGLAEIAAGSIAMGLGGFLAARGEAEHYASEQAREEREIVEKPQAEEQEIRDVFSAYGIPVEQSEPVVAALKARPKEWVEFMMRFELGLEKPEPKRALASARNIAVAYIAGGMIPLAPYMVQRAASSALLTSVAVTMVALGLFGALKARFSGTSPWRSAMQTFFIGGLAAAAAYLLAKVVSSGGHIG